MAKDRISKINEEVRRELSNIVRELKDTRIPMMTSIVAVRVTNDLSYAKVYFTVLDDSKKEDTLKALNQASGFVRTKLFDRIDIRHMPKLEFIYDDSIEYGNDIEKKIKEIHEKDGE